MKKKPQRIITLQDIIIPKGTIFYPSPIRRDYADGHFDTVIGYGNDHCACLTIDRSLAREYHNQFLILED